jgi:ABC-type Na+ efflux pump permease subunit
MHRQARRRIRHPSARWPIEDKDDVLQPFLDGPDDAGTPGASREQVAAANAPRNNGINPELIDNLLDDLDVASVQISRSGEKKTGGELNFLVAFIFGALLVLPSFVYGRETMRGIVQEKTDRVVEVLISSVRPIELLTGRSSASQPLA